MKKEHEEELELRKEQSCNLKKPLWRQSHYQLVYIQRRNSHIPTTAPSTTPI